MVSASKCSAALGLSRVPCFARHVTLSSLHLRSRPCRTLHAASTDGAQGTELSRVAVLMSGQDLTDEKKQDMEQIASALNISLGSVRQMAYKRPGLLTVPPEELKSSIKTIATVVGVSEGDALKMAVLQPGLLFNSQRQAEVLEAGIRSICYELDAPKEEVVELIIENPSVLVGHEMHLSVADLAHLSMIREKRSGIV